MVATNERYDLDDIFINNSQKNVLSKKFLNSEEKKRILYVEDCLEVQEVTLDQVTSQFPDVEIVTARSGNKAKEILYRNCDFDLIVTDYQMKDGDGLELLTFCERERFQIPVIVFHGGRVEAELFHLASKSCVAVVIKSGYDELKSRINDLI